MCPCLSIEVVVIKLSQNGLVSLKNLSVHFVVMLSSLMFAYGPVGSFVLSFVVSAYDDRISHS